MSKMFIRSLIMYCLLILSVRLMGKREIGQLQPAELVTTLLISEIAALPIENTEIPFLHCVAAVLFIVVLEIIMSIMTLKLSKFRHIVQGNSLLVISEGKIVQKAMKKMRLTVDDLIEGLRLKDVFDISEVDYAYIETNGQLSVKLKDEKEPIKAEAFGKSSDGGGIPFVLISDGRLISESLGQCGLTEEKLDLILEEKGLIRNDILILAADKNGVTYLAEKKGKR